MSLLDQPELIAHPIFDGQIENIRVGGFHLRFAVPITLGPTYSSMPVIDADLLAERWKTKYGLTPRIQFDFHKNLGGGLELGINGVYVMDAGDYANFYIAIERWAKMLKEDKGGFNTGEPGDGFEFEFHPDNTMTFKIWRHWNWHGYSWVFPDARAFRVALMHAYAEVAIWVRAADPAYYEELIKNGTLPVPAPAR